MQTLRIDRARFRRAALVLAACAWFAPANASSALQTLAPVAPKTTLGTKKHPPPTELFEIVKVVDGDTIHVRRNGAIEKLRLLSVDTEERLGAGGQGSATKPQTVFGEECALWAQEFFAALATDGQPSRVGLLFPPEMGAGKKDIYGRLLCHVVLPDGTDYDVMLVELGKSPYFNKYGNSTVDHAAFVAAQKHAQAGQLGIWNPEANAPSTPGAPAAKRPYRELLDWWDARALAVDDFRKRQAQNPELVVDCEDPVALKRAADAKREVEVFGEVDRLFDEASGDQTVLFRAPDKNKALRVRIPAAIREAHVVLDLPALTQEFRQNYAWFKGRVDVDERGFKMIAADPKRWRRAGPEPSLYRAAKQ
jgi:micrococcal nuclease